MNKKCAFFILLTAPLSILSDNSFGGFAQIVDSHCKRIHQEINAMMDDMFDDFQESSIELSSKSSMPMPTISKNNTHVLISMMAPSIDPDTIEIKKMSDRNDEYVQVTVPEKSMEITITPRQIAYSSKQETKQEKTKDEKTTALYYSMGTSSMQQSLPCEVTFDDITAEYKDGHLTISLSKVNPKNNIQVIPVVKK